MTGVVEAARKWIGTPYIHQASVRGAGCDCLGLVRGVWREVLGAEPVLPPPYTRDWSEPGGRETLLDAARTFLTERPTTSLREGQVLLFRMRDDGVAKHLGILTEAGTVARFVHAYGGRTVCETTLSLPWRRRMVATYDFPEEVT